MADSACTSYPVFKEPTSECSLRPLGSAHQTASMAVFRGTLQGYLNRERLVNPVNYQSAWSRFLLRSRQPDLTVRRGKPSRDRTCGVRSDRTTILLILSRPVNPRFALRAAARQPGFALPCYGPESQPYTSWSARQARNEHPILAGRPGRVNCTESSAVRQRRQPRPPRFALTY